MLPPASRRAWKNQDGSYISMTGLNAWCRCCLPSPGPCFKWLRITNPGIETKWEAYISLWLEDSQKLPSNMQQHTFIPWLIFNGTVMQSMSSYCTIQPARKHYGLFFSTTVCYPILAWKTIAGATRPRARGTPSLITSRFPAVVYHGNAGNTPGVSFVTKFTRNSTARPLVSDGKRFNSTWASSRYFFALEDSGLRKGRGTDGAEFKIGSMNW